MTTRLIRGLALVLLMGVAGCSTVAEVEHPRLAIEASTPEAKAEAVETLVRMGAGRLASGDPSTAIGLLNQALATDPRHREANLLLGQAFLALGQPQEAGAAYGRVLQRDVSDREAALGYAKAMIAIGRYEAALAHVEPLALRRPDDREAVNLHGVALDLMGEHARAVDVYRAGLAHHREAPELLSNLGLSLALAGRADEAIGVLLPLAEGYESSPRARQNLALAYGLAGRFAEAERWSRLDLGADDVAGNLSYFQALRDTEPGALRAASMQPDLTAPPARPVDRRPPVAARSEAVSPPPADRPIEMRARPAATGTRSDTAPPPRSLVPMTMETMTPTLAPPEPVAVSAMLGDDGTVAGRWFLRLGSFPSSDAASEHWRLLRAEHPDLAAGLQKLAVAGETDVPLVVGPFAHAAAAGDVCRRLVGRSASSAVPEPAALTAPDQDSAAATHCRPVRL